MSKRYRIGIIVIALMVAGLAALNAWINAKVTAPAFTDADLAGRSQALAASEGWTNPPTRAGLVPLDMSKPVRLAIGGLGLKDSDQNQRLGDLVTAELNGAAGFDLVERQALGAILKELDLSWSGFVRAKDAVRAGNLLKADWFLLGTEANFNGTNALVVRVVDAHTGVLRDAGVFPSDQPPAQLAADLAMFLRQSRQNAALAKTRVYLAIGAFEDLSANNRQADFPAQVSSYLTAAYQGGQVTFLEREYVEFLLQEATLDLAGLAEDASTNPPPMQSAFWLISGKYQSYETTNFQVELNLEVRRAFGSRKTFTLYGLPGESINRQIKHSIDEAMDQSTNYSIFTGISEVKAQMTIGRDLVLSFSPIRDFDTGLIYVPMDDFDPEIAAKQKRQVEAAMRAFQTVLLLESTNREAKMYLAACFRHTTINRLAEARNYYRELIEETVQDQWLEIAQKALIQTFARYWWGGPTREEEAIWYEAAALHATNPAAIDFFHKQAESARGEIAIQSDVSKLQARAESQLLENITNAWLGSYSEESAGIGDFVKTFGTNQAAAAHRLTELFPKLQAQAPALAPYLLAQFVTVQVDTNSPLVAEFKQMVEHYADQPDQVFMPDKFWERVWPACEWCCDHQCYGTAIKLLEGKARAVLLYPQQFRQIESEKSTDKMGLAYAYAGNHEWQKALNIFDTYSNQPVQIGANGPWGQMFCIIFPGKQADLCRLKLGQSAPQNPIDFSMGEPLFCLCTPSTFSADDDGLWIGINGQLLQLDFDLKTNLVINLPLDPLVKITQLCVTASNIWIGTDGAGLLAFDKITHAVKTWTEKDGLMMNYITSLHLSGDTLWIGYGTISEMGLAKGGLGKLELTTGRFTSYTPSLTKDPQALRHTTGNIVVESTDQPTRRQVLAVAGRKGSEAWFATDMHPLRHYQAVSNTWDGIGQLRWVTCLLATDDNLFAGQSYNDLGQVITGPLGVSVLDFKNGQWRSLKGAEQIPPGDVSTLCLDGTNIWVGGAGYIALADPKQDKLLRYAPVQAKAVNRIQTGGGYVWAQFDWHLYRAPLTDARPAFLQKNFNRFVRVQFQKNTNGEAQMQRFRAGQNVFAYKDRYYCGFQFTVPPWLDGDVGLMYVLDKAESEKDFSLGVMVSNLIPEAGPPAPAYAYYRESLEHYPKLQKQFPYTGNVTVQNLGRNSFEPGKTYAIWFETDKASLPDIAFALTVNSQRGTNEFGALPIR